MSDRDDNPSSPGRGGKGVAVVACLAWALLAGPAATLDRAKSVARRLIDPDRLSFAIVGDPADLTPTRIVPDPGL